MFHRNSLITRITIGKALGLVFGIVGFLILPYFIPEPELLLRWGILLWYTTFGAIIGVFGVITWHPVLHLPLPWWIRAGVVGGWLNFVLAFFTYSSFGIAAEPAFYQGSFSRFALWITLEGVVVGTIIGYIATRFGGEGSDIVDTVPPDASGHLAH